MTMLRMCLPVAMAVALAVTARSQAAGTRLFPVDEAPRNPDFLRFRNTLRQIVVRRDVPALLAIVDPRIKNSFGGDDGIEAFKEMWRPEQPDSKIWQELDDVLSLGGTFSGPDTFVAPYVFSRWPEAFDPYEHVAVTGSNVRVRASADRSGRIMGSVTFSVLLLATGDRRETQRSWAAVELPDGRKGYVSSSYLRSPIDYRAFFVRTGGRWLMTTFIAGD